MDPLSDVLGDLRAEDVVTGRFSLGAPWSFRKAAVAGAAFRTATGHPYYICIDAMNPVRVEPGDCVLLPHGNEHVMCSAPEVEPVLFDALVGSKGIHPRFDTPLEFSAGGNGPVSELYTGIVMFGERARNPLFAALPSLIHIRAGDPAVPSWLTTTLTNFIEESMARRPGWRVAVARLADVLFVQILRAYLLANRHEGINWLRGMANPQIGKVIAMIHREPQTPWTVPQLAAIAGMSRSKFCTRFRELVGESPISYLTAHRMYLAAGRLALDRSRILEVAEAVGYASEKAFTRAFHRWYGLPPREYVRNLSTRL
ncbi:MAG: AraC family transcriptional regulator [Rhodoferax sp.]|nr:AraC family transcriptional regulator [Rhodoferax sp.]